MSQKLQHYQQLKTQVIAERNKVNTYALMQRVFGTPDGQQLMNILNESYLLRIIGKLDVESANYLNGAADLIKEFLLSSRGDLTAMIKQVEAKEKDLIALENELGKVT